MNITGKYLKVWDVTVKNGFTKLNLGDSVKKKDGTYDNWTWFDCTLLGNAKDVQVSKGDTIEVVSGLIAKRKFNDKWYDDIRLFEINIQSKGGSQQNNLQNEGFVSVDEDISFPF